MKNCYIIINKDTGKMLVTKDEQESFQFITENKNVQIKVVTSKGTTKTIDKRKFLSEWYFFSEDKWNACHLSDILISRMDNRRKLLSKLKLLRVYKQYLVRD